MTQHAPDAEDRVLSKNPRFRKLIAEARASKVDGGLTLEEVARELDITPADEGDMQALDCRGLSGTLTGRPARKLTPGEAVAGR